jgi:hypothetical protein
VIFLLSLISLFVGPQALGICESLLIDSSISDQNLHHYMEYDQFTSPIWVINPPSSHDFLDVEFPSDEAILEAMTMDDRPWEDMHHILFFLPKLETLEVDYQRNPWPEPSNGLYLKKYYA